MYPHQIEALWHWYCYLPAFVVTVWTLLPREQRIYEIVCRIYDVEYWKFVRVTLLLYAAFFLLMPIANVFNSASPQKYIFYLYYTPFSLIILVIFISITIALIAKLLDFLVSGRIPIFFPSLRWWRVKYLLKSDPTLVVYPWCVYFDRSYALHEELAAIGSNRAFRMLVDLWIGTSTLQDLLDKHGYKKAIAPLSKRLLEPGTTCENRIRAAQALGRSKDRRAISALIKATADSDAGVREAAIASLGQFSQRKSLLHLESLLDSPDVRIRLEAAKSIEHATVRGDQRIGS